ncbi:hypothetical protein [Microbacterium caowuchunii]|uniref:Uncharacterized protein n=1 Tax=Microbacterium caowuchunii TaxID=2614638 RepID=A0A5N0TH33_9MICO|nr:hypothetical protein [Microbacterium caowuchunii]KAA9133768.1 hypothetical protein F6B40_08435 [Microbacterium caowuchunii]
MGLIRGIRAAWFRIREPRVLRVLYWFAYLIAFLVGVGTLLNPSDAIENAWGPWVAMSWAAFWALGGVAGMATCLTGWWQVERSAVGLILTGLGIYAVVLGVLAVLRGNSPSWIATVSLAVLLFIIRLVLIRGHDFEPRG